MGDGFGLVCGLWCLHRKLRLTQLELSWVWQSIKTAPAAQEYEESELVFGNDFTMYSLVKS